MKNKGFTVVELIIAVILVILAGSVFFIEKQGLAASERDSQRKTAINAMYYSLEEVYYKKNQHYPKSISEKNLPSVEPRLFTDPNGKKVMDPASNYRYEATGCDGGETCKGYRLRADLEKESDFILNSRNN